tara:strand:- start:636 stop:1049 length:414 start_codon:yes stop_codon:yes gene_type:complete
MSLDKTFFIEMMTNGIPVKENIDLATVFKLVDEQSETGGYEVVIVGDELGILDKNNNICTSLKMIEDIKGDYRLVFFTPIDQDQLLEIAHSVGAVLMVTISACAQTNSLNMLKIPKPDLIEAPTGKEESTEFESDFI